MKKLTCFLLTLLLLVSLATPVALAAGSRFSDVPAGAWFAEAVDWAVDAQITQGTGADTFSPDEGCTRAQIVTFLFRAAGSPAASAYDGSFSDVAASAYYAQAVQWAVAQGITKGTGEGQFSPDKTCTSHSSPLGTSAETLKGLLGEDVTWLPSRRFAAGTGEEPLAAWLTEIGLLAKQKTAGPEPPTWGSGPTIFAGSDLDQSCTRPASTMACRLLRMPSFA